ncbi:glucuronyl hydrolase [Vibrio inusitatus NBRC 102082]|uniref:Glucuronyl hydrolase n=1 Tax=Vibrio inusitatus NBRC 102082 TaxID=1219070 RepID=A0A4Y3HT23_9VIBR|nr:glycoside hydrolase family 88 protein [Vibrio inusitatus]GEA49900.1 glucuronyl hydrolase [Vibrio inusitatus NBRC 102082]
MTEVLAVKTIKADIVESIQRNVSRIGTRNPMVGDDGPDFEYLYPEDYFWTDSFWTGQLWLAYGLTGDESLKNSARTRNAHLETILNTPLWIDHDLGFLFSLSVVADYKLTGCEKAKSLGLRAADALRNRFNYCGNYIQAWNASSDDPEKMSMAMGKIIIDCMQNLGLMLWAYKETGIESYREVALAQAETSAQYLVREDYSTYHTFDFDPKTGKPVGGKTHQGFADESCWSRGHSWAVHGFAKLAETTGDMKYAELSAKLADYVIENITPDGVPVWDYRLPLDEVQYKDTSAGAVTAAGLFILANVLIKAGQVSRGTRYHDFALKMLKGLRDEYDLTGMSDAQGLLRGAAQFVKEGQRENKPHLIQGMLPYGDYYYFEAVLLACGHTDFFWE